MPIHSRCGEPTHIFWCFERSKLAHVDGIALVESNQFAKVVILRVPGKSNMQSITAPLIVRDNCHAVEPCKEQSLVVLVEVANAVCDEGMGSAMSLRLTVAYD
jgi:hypothetical protein